MTVGTLSMPHFMYYVHALLCCILHATDIRTLMFVHHGFACSAYVPHYVVTGVDQNCQHYQERTQSTLFCDPLPPYQEYFENVDFETPSKNRNEP